jgi:hypothetical protein
VNLRWPLVSSVAALATGFIIALLVVAFCGGSDEGTAGVTADRTPTATRTARSPTRTPSPGTRTPTATPTSEGEEPTEAEATPSEESPVPPGEVPPEGGEPGETPTELPAGETPIVGTPSPSVTPSLAFGTPAATKPPASASPGRSPTPPPTSTPRPTATPTLPPQLPDLVVVDMRVSRDRIVVEVGNVGEGDVQVGQVVEVWVRGVPAESRTMAIPMTPGGGFNFLLEGEPLYKRENVQARVDPNNLIAEEDDNNNTLSKELVPDVLPDLGIHGLLAVGSNDHLAVLVRNETDVPILGADVRLFVYAEGASEATAFAQQILNLDPGEEVQVEVTQLAAVRGRTFEVRMDVLEVPDANPANNIFQGVAS